ncbi:bifunctional diaminohydroxyphosphoribosylaminopyrimidine deaminase/5-amino-6-(5-phosphoribosylamino)uracil reductase RibD [Patescibacteria group bacterium]|nr:bifunctional diaminohydroxyphosphoribosylaminopyrimidine deaminase/5-amino-6-(5-phosphoribosylamino)uracil reductase RibD [Patescibacteria group bacterium]
MRRAIELAKKAANPSPNPRVGCVILRNGRIIGEGWHERAGEPHAEILALRKAGKRARDGELFVNLEPCHRFGRTPPCTRAILRAGVKKVVIGMPDQTKAGGGAEFLAKNGVVVEMGICGKECRELNQIWLKNANSLIPETCLPVFNSEVAQIRRIGNASRGLPFVALKLALDSNGSTIPVRGKKWITGNSAKRKVMRLRRNFDAIAVGVGTILKDNPQLTVRGLKIKKQPTRIIFDPNLRTPKSAKVLQSGGTILVSRKPVKIPRARNLVARNFDLKTILKKLFKLGISSIFLEGGETTARKFLAEQLIDHIFIFQKNARGIPKICGQKLPLQKVRKFGNDTFFEGALRKY